MTPTASPFEFEAWLIDLDGTLYYSMPVKFIMGVKVFALGWTTGRTTIPILRTFRQQHIRKADEHPITEHPWNGQLYRTAKRHRCTVDQVRGIVAHWMIEQPRPWLKRFRRRWLVQAIHTFREQGGKTALVSDYPAKKKLQGMGIGHLFDTVIANGESESPHPLKPSPAAFLSATAQLNIPPEHCLIIGDREDQDGKAAINAGMSHVILSGRQAKQRFDFFS